MSGPLATEGQAGRTWLGWPSRGALFAELVVYAGVAVWLMRQYSVEVNAFDRAGIRLQTHELVAGGEAMDPYRYRLLVPLALDLLQQSGAVPSGAVWLDRAYFLFFGGCFAGLFLATRVMLTTYGWRPTESLVGPLLLAALMPMAFRYHDFQPWTWPEALSIALVVIVLLKRANLAWVIGIVALASLNRETALVLTAIPIAMALSRPRGSRLDHYLVKAAVGSFIVWSAIRLVLVFGVPGPASGRVIDLSEILRRNTNPESIFALAFTVALFVLPVLVPAIVGVVQGAVPGTALWIAAVTAPLFLGGYLVFALWIEVRVLVPAVVVLLPLVLAAFTRPTGGEHHGAKRGVSSGPEPLSHP